MKVLHHPLLPKEAAPSTAPEELEVPPSDSDNDDVVTSQNASNHVVAAVLHFWSLSSYQYSTVTSILYSFQRIDLLRE